MKHTGDVLKEIMLRQGLRQIDIVAKCQPFCRKYNVRIGKEDVSQYINKKAKPNQDRVAILADNKEKVLNAIDDMIPNVVI